MSFVTKSILEKHELPVYGVGVKSMFFGVVERIAADRKCVASAGFRCVHVRVLFLLRRVEIGWLRCM